MVEVEVEEEKCRKGRKGCRCCRRKWRWWEWRRRGVWVEKGRWKVGKREGKERRMGGGGDDGDGWRRKGGGGVKTELEL